MRMLRYFLESLQLFGGPAARSAYCWVSVSLDTPIRDLSAEYPWVSDYPVGFRWVDEKEFRRWRYDCTGFDRFAVESDCDVVILADTDLLVAGDFDEVILRSHQKQIHQGFITHVSPFEQRAPLSRRWLKSRRGWLRNILRFNSSEEWWGQLYREAGLGPPRMDRVHSAWEILSRNPRFRVCPNHFNYGFLVAPRSQVDAIGRCFVSQLEVVDRVVESGYKSQIAHTLSLDQCGIPCDLLSLNDNFPLNLPEEPMRRFNPDPGGANGAEDVRIFHYLGVGDVNQSDFSSDRRLQRLLHREFERTSLVRFQQALQQTHNQISKT